MAVASVESEYLTLKVSRITLEPNLERACSVKQPREHTDNQQNFLPEADFEPEAKPDFEPSHRA